MDLFPPPHAVCTAFLCLFGGGARSPFLASSRRLDWVIELQSFLTSFFSLPLWVRYTLFFILLVVSFNTLKYTLKISRRIRCVATEGNWALSGEHTIERTGDKLGRCAPEFTWWYWPVFPQYVYSFLKKP